MAEAVIIVEVCGVRRRTLVREFQHFLLKLPTATAIRGHGRDSRFIDIPRAIIKNALEHIIETNHKWKVVRLHPFGPGVWLLLAALAIPGSPFIGAGSGLFERPGTAGDVRLTSGLFESPGERAIGSCLGWKGQHRERQRGANKCVSHE